MASLSAPLSKARRAAPLWDRPEGLGLTLSIVIPLAAVVIGNGLIYASGSLNNPDYEAVSWGPPGWLIGVIWCVIYPLWGAARWKVAAKNDAMSGRSLWVVALIVWGLCYPVVTAFTGTLGSVVANILSLVLAIMTTIRVWPASMAAVGLIAPSILWLCIANAFGFAALEGAS